MEKYGVQTTKTKDEAEKTGAEGDTCDSCGRPLLNNANVLICPVCGTKPYEKEAEEDLGAGTTD